MIKVRFLFALLFFVLFNLKAGLAADATDGGLEKDKLDFGDVIKESTKEVREAETTYKKVVKTKKYVPRKSKGKTNVKLDVPKETVQVEDHIEWDHNRKEAVLQKKKLDNMNTLDTSK
jgi:hypothetical protein